MKSILFLVRQKKTLEKTQNQIFKCIAEGEYQMGIRFVDFERAFVFCFCLFFFVFKENFVFFRCRANDPALPFAAPGRMQMSVPRLCK